MRSSFFMRKYWVKSGKKRIAYSRAAERCLPGQDQAVVHSWAASYGIISSRCIPEGAPDRKNALSWQDIAAMYPK